MTGELRWQRPCRVAEHGMRGWVRAGGQVRGEGRDAESRARRGGDARGRGTRRGYLEDKIGVVLVQHVGLAERGDDHPAVPPRRLQVGVEPVLGAVHREEAVHQVPLDLGQAVRRGQEVLHALLYLVAAEAGAQQDGDEHGRRGEEHRVAGDEVAEPGEGRPQPPVQDLPQHPSAEGAQESERHAGAPAAPPRPSQDHGAAPPGAASPPAAAAGGRGPPPRVCVCVRCVCAPARPCACAGRLGRSSARNAAVPERSFPAPRRPTSQPAAPRRGAAARTAGVGVRGGQPRRRPAAGRGKRRSPPPPRSLRGSGAARRLLTNPPAAAGEARRGGRVKPSTAPPPPPPSAQGRGATPGGAEHGAAGAAQRRASRRGRPPAAALGTPRRAPPRPAPPAAAGTAAPGTTGQRGLLAAPTG